MIELFGKEIPSKMDELTLEQFQKISAIHNNEEYDTLEKHCKVFEYLGITEDEMDVDFDLFLANVKFKEQKWIPFSPALQEALSIPGIPLGHNSMVRGKSNTGKSTMTIEIAVNAQKMGILPVLIITEMKLLPVIHRSFGHNQVHLLAQP